MPIFACIDVVIITLLNRNSESLMDFALIAYIAYIVVLIAYWVLLYRRRRRDVHRYISQWDGQPDDGTKPESTIETNEEIETWLEEEQPTTSDSKQSRS